MFIFQILKLSAFIVLTCLDSEFYSSDTVRPLGPSKQVTDQLCFAAQGPWLDPNRYKEKLQGLIKVIELLDIYEQSL